MAKEVSRRELLSAAVVLSGLSAGCQLFNDDQKQTDMESSVAPLTQGQSNLYVERSVSDLPANPGQLAYAITSEGILQYSESGSGWRAIQWGTANNPAPEANVRNVSIGHSPAGRPLISNGDQTVYVDPSSGDDSGEGTEEDPLATIQEAVYRAPIYLRDQYVVDLATVPETPVTYDEDVLVPTIIGTGQATREDSASQPGPFLNLVIRGQQSDPEAVRIGSVMFGNVVGTAAGNLFHVTISRNTPYDSEQFALTAYGTGEVHLYDIHFTGGPRNAILSYGAKMKASLVDLGQRNVNIGIRGKRHASIISDRASGVTRNKGYLAISNSRIGIKQGETLSGDPTYSTRLGGIIHDENTDTWYGGPVSQSADDASSRTSSQFSPRVTPGHPPDADPGEIYYVTGTGNVEEGFYGRMEDGPVRLG